MHGDGGVRPPRTDERCVMNPLDPQLPEGSARDWLTRREAELRAEIGDATQPESAGDREVLDRKDEAGENALRDVASAEVERDLAELREVQAALQRLDEGSWGRCADCEEPIDPRRLAVQPAALRCAACQARREA